MNPYELIKAVNLARHHRDRVHARLAKQYNLSGHELDISSLTEHERAEYDTVLEIATCAERVALDAGVIKCTQCGVMSMVMYSKRNNENLCRICYKWAYKVDPELESMEAPY